MGAFVAVRNGGKTDENGALRFLRRASTNGQGQVQQGDMQVTQHSTPNQSIDIAIGDLIIAYQDYIFYTWIDALFNLAITTNTSGNPRIDTIVAYVDLTVVSSASNNNPGALKFIDVTGTPAVSPVAPTTSAIQSAVGAGNPFYSLANIAVANNFTTIVNANVTDLRTKFILGTSTKYLIYQPGVLAVANDLSLDIPGVPLAQTLTTLSAYAKTAPVGSGLTMRLYNITQSVEIGSVTIAAGSQFATTSTFVTPNINAGDIIRLDCTAIGSTTPGSNVTVLAY